MRGTAGDGGHLGQGGHDYAGGGGKSPLAATNDSYFHWKLHAGIHLCIHMRVNVPQTGQAQRKSAVQTGSMGWCFLF